ncbi:hypothetical protein AcW1_001020 [Taiwanofungus camphoratus]|nr:hypothetical protein AcW2_000479 [Antrodia cinnamomea]KAI0964130.1 hypothetical protein AcW1_001020 [Antrodia cinnamomea]
MVNDSVKQRIISSVFSKLNSSGNTWEEHYVSHVKIWEDDTRDRGRKKPRYIVLAHASNGAGFIHKTKLNCDKFFSIGKTWKLAELRAVEVINPLVFNITPRDKCYKWQTERQRDQINFIASLVQLFRTVTGGSAPLRLVGVKTPDDFSSPRPPWIRSAPRIQRTHDSTDDTSTPASTSSDTLTNGTSPFPARSTRPPVVRWVCRN